MPGDEQQTVSRHVDLEAQVDEVWEALVGDEERGRWMGGDTELSAEPGGRGFIVDDDGRRREVLVEQVEPGRRLSFDWWTEDDAPSHVEFVLVPIPTGTRLTVIERPLVPGARLRSGAFARRANLMARGACLAGV